MEINLNNPEELTFENVALLIGSKDDSEHRQIRVSKEGIASLSDDFGNTNSDNLIYRIETFCAGNGYTGAAAAKNEDWVSKVLEILREEGLGQKGSTSPMA